MQSQFQLELLHLSAWVCSDALKIPSQNALMADLDVMTLFSALNQTVIASLSNLSSHIVWDNFDNLLGFESSCQICQNAGQGV